MNAPSRGAWKLVVSVSLMLLVAAAATVLMQGAPVAGADARDTVARLDELSDAFSHIVKQSSPAVVSIEVKKELRRQPRPFSNPKDDPFDMFPWFFGPQQPRQEAPMPRGPVPYGQGTGFIISADGYIVTNHHVVGQADEVNVTLADGREFEAELVGSDPETEIALIKIDGKRLPTIPLGNSDDIEVGEWVLAIGSPFGFQHSVTAGIVSAKGRGNSRMMGGPDFYADFIQTDAAINPGNSGGPLLNADGEVIGMNTAIFSRSGGYMGIGFAIPVNMVKFIVDQIRDTGTVTRGQLGVAIQNVTPEIAEWFGVQAGQGVLISDVEPGLAADKAGLEQDDIILEHDGRTVEDISSFRSRVASTRPGTRMNLLILRDGKRMTKTVTVGGLGAEIQTGSASSTAQTQLGLTVEELTGELAEKLEYEGESGVVVSAVQRGSAAEMARVERGMLIQMVNRQPVKTVAEFQEAVEKGKERGSILLLVQAGKYSQYITIELDE